MGEFADMLIDQMFDDVFADQDVEDGEFNFSSKDRKCRYCGAKELHWRMDGEYWRLHTKTNKVHTCKKYKSTEAKSKKSTQEIADNLRSICNKLTAEERKKYLEIGMKMINASSISIK